MVWYTAQKVWEALVGGKVTWNSRQEIREAKQFHRLVQDPNIATTANTPLHFQSLLDACCVTATNSSALHSQTAPSVLQGPSHSVKIIWVIQVISLSNPTPPPTAMLPPVLCHLGDLSVDTDQVWPLYHLSYPAVLISHYTIRCPAELQVCALRKWEFSRCGRQDKTKTTLK